MGLTPEQHDTLMRPLKPSRVAKRTQGGKQLSYLESWDVRAHLIRVFDFANFDIRLLDQYLVGVREYTGDKPMVEPMWFAKVEVTVRDLDGQVLAVYSDAAVGSNAAPASMIAEAHDNAMKTAASDAMKRCCINLGTQFGLGLYDSGSLMEVVRQIVGSTPDAEPTAEQQTNINHTLGTEQPDERGSESDHDPVPATT